MPSAPASPRAADPSGADPADAATPRVSVVMAAFDAERHVEAAIRSALSQALPGGPGAIEVIVADDASRDGTAALVGRLAAGDPRLLLLPAERNGGPGAARNRALGRARGEWVAVMDSDDLMRPGRLARLLEAAGACGADIVADNLALFGDDGAPERPLLPESAPPRWVSLPDYVRSNALHAGEPALGYLKPMIRRDLLLRAGVRYDERLRVAEDYDLVLRLLAAGGRMRLLPRADYRYRRHGESISHRLSEPLLEAMLLADRRFRDDHPSLPPEALRALDARRRSLDHALDFERIVAAIKARRPLRAARLALLRPRAALLLRWPLGNRLRRLLPRAGRA